jgi:hypothetical protein
MAADLPAARHGTAAQPQAFQLVEGFAVFIPLKGREKWQAVPWCLIRLRPNRPHARLFHGRSMKASTEPMARSRGAMASPSQKSAGVSRLLSMWEGCGR